MSAFSYIYFVIVLLTVKGSNGLTTKTHWSNRNKNLNMIKSCSKLVSLHVRFMYHQFQLSCTNTAALQANCLMMIIIEPSFFSSCSDITEAKIYRKLEPLTFALNFDQLVEFLCYEAQRYIIFQPFFLRRE